MDILKDMLQNVKETAPLVHFLTNYVTVNDCANITLACGGSPIMSDERKEAAQIAALCSSMVINIGTVNSRTLESMLYAGRAANDLGIPVIFDPAGAGCSTFRNEAIELLLREINFSVIKGNISEVKFLSSRMGSAKGVDAAKSDLVTEENLEQSMQFARKLSVLTGSIIVITGPLDIVCSSESSYVLYNGCPIMAEITGSGCMSAALLGCFVGANPEFPLQSAITATAFMGICGEIAWEKMKNNNLGLGSFRTLLIDAAGMLGEEQLLQKTRLKIFPALVTSSLPFTV